MKEVFIETRQAISVKDLALYLASVLNPEDAAEFIVRLDLAFQDWSITEALIRHFNAIQEHDVIDYLGIDTSPKEIEI